MITQQQLKSRLRYDPVTGVFIWIRNDKIAGTRFLGYIRINISGSYYLSHRLAWLYVYGRWPENQIDHRDQIKNHNWISNLREVTGTVNHRNMPKNKNNTSGFTGVSWHTKSRKWRAYIVTDDKNICLGSYINKEDAISARIQANTTYNYHKNHGVK